MADDLTNRYTGNLKRTPSDNTGNEIKPGPYIGIVRNHLDTKFMGNLEIELLHKSESGNQTNEQNQLIQARYLSPFAGTTPRSSIKEQEGHEYSQKSYGMWFVPPDIDTMVLVIFAEGGEAFWLGCIPDDYVNIMTPASDPATTYNSQDKSKRLPVGEYNKKLAEGNGNDPTRFEKPVNTDILDVLKKQGLVEDETRGITSSSARREVPSAVFGISTPGPYDKRLGSGPTSSYGPNRQTANIPHNRLGGSSFVLDDGDESFVRKERATEGPPEYVNKEDGERGGDVTRPHNEMLRFKTRTGHQIMMHNSEELIYVCNSNGTAWVELTADGKIDVYSKDSINLHSEQDFNIKADRDINIEADRDFNVKTKKNINIESLKDTQVVVGENSSITTRKGKLDLWTKKGNKFTASEGKTEINSGDNHVETAPQIHMNGPAATIAEKAEPLPTYSLPGKPQGSKENVIMKRVPQHEPWMHHENLSPKNFKPVKTDIRKSEPPKKGDFTSNDPFQEQATIDPEGTATGGTTGGVTGSPNESSFGSSRGSKSSKGSTPTPDKDSDNNTKRYPPEDSSSTTNIDNEISDNKKKSLACTELTEGFDFCFSKEKLNELLKGVEKDKVGEWYQLLKEKLPEYGITTEKRVASFLSQVGHESRNFTQIRENLNYQSSDRIRKVFGNRFVDSSVRPSDLVGNPEKTANFVYSDMLGNGPPESGDGWKFRGGGLMQLTGRNNYEAFAKSQGITADQASNFVETKEGALVSALWFWKRNDLNSQTDHGGIEQVTQTINGGQIGIDDRKRRFSKALSVLSAGNEEKGLSKDGSPLAAAQPKSNDSFRKNVNRRPNGSRSKV